MLETDLFPKCGPLRRLLARLTQRLSAVAPPPAPPDDLRTCSDCHEPFACPIDWGTSDDSHWWILLRCGSCEHYREVVVTDEQATGFELELARDTLAIAGVVDRLDRERMRAEADVFATALARDLIDAADFAR